MTANQVSQQLAADRAGPAPARRREWLSVLGRAARTPRGAAGLAIGGAVILLAVIGPLVAPKSATAFVTLPFSRPSASLPLGGDVLGRDVLSRTLDGGWELLLMAAVATALGVAAGTACGVTGAYAGGWADHVLMRTVDIVLAFPQLIFALLLVSVIGPKAWLIVLAVGISHAPQVARVTRAAALDVCERDFVRAAQILGIPGRKVLSREVLPSLTSVLMVEVGLRFTYSILVIAGLSFLGFGLQPPSPNWGQMINENRVGLATNPWGVLAPTILIALLTIGVNTFTDAVARSSLGVGRGFDDAQLLDPLAAGATQ
jgi:peptide/nickel transport system permease protein